MHKRLHLAIICMLMLLTGCWDSVEIENRAFVTVAAFDRHVGQSGKSELKVSIYPITSGEYKPEPNSKEQDDEGEEGEEGEESISTSHLMEALVDTLTEAIHVLNAQTEKKIFLGQLKAIIFSKSLLDDAELMNALAAELEDRPDIDHRVYIVCADNAAEMLSIMASTNERNPASYITSVLRDKEKMEGETFRLDLETFTMQLRKGGATTIPYLFEKNGKPVLSGFYDMDP